MDGLDLHPYPIPQSLPFETGYPGRTSFSVANLPRAYQAFYDAFNGHRPADGRAGAAPGQPERGRDPDHAERRGRGRLHRVRERRGRGRDRLGGLPGDVVPEARRLLALRRRRDEGEHLQARRRDVAAGLAERALLRRLRPEAVGGGVHATNWRSTAGLCPTGDAAYFVPGSARPPASAGSRRRWCTRSPSPPASQGRRGPLTRRTPVR